MKSTKLKPGSRLLAYTDGLTEVFRGDDEFGLERLAETFYASRAEPGDAVLDHLWRTLEAFSSETGQRDDMTALNFNPPMTKKDEPLSAQANSIELSLPSRLGYEKVAMNTAASVAKLMGFSEDRVEDLKTAVAEACINSMEHGNKLDASLKVGVILSMSENSLEIQVRDRGTGVQGEVHAPNIDKKMHGEESPRGLGMFLIQALVDEAEWVGSAEDGGCTRLVIHLKEPKRKNVG